MMAKASDTKSGKVMVPEVVALGRLIGRYIPYIWPIYGRPSEEGLTTALGMSRQPHPTVMHSPHCKSWRSGNVYAVHLF